MQAGFYAACNEHVAWLWLVTGYSLSAIETTINTGSRTGDCPAFVAYGLSLLRRGENVPCVILRCA